MCPDFIYENISKYEHILFFSHSTREVASFTRCLAPCPSPPLLLNIDILAIFSYQYIKYFLPPPPLLNTMWPHQVALVVKNPPAGDVRDSGSIPGPGRSPGEGNGNPLQYPCLENPMDRGAWWATVHRFAEGRTQLKQQHIHTASSK